MLEQELLMTTVSYLAESEPTPVVGIGRIFAEALAFIRAEPAEFWGATLALTIAPSILAQFPGVIGRIFSYGSLVPALFYSAIISTMVYDRACQRPVRFERAARSIARTHSLFGLSVLSGLGIGLGLVALIVPGLFLIALWFVAVPACAVEQLTAKAAMSRSVELTRGNRMRLLAIAGVGGAVCAVPLLILGFTLGLSPAKAEVFSGAWFLQSGLMTLYAIMARR
jgi:hypothetical protein